MKLKLNSTDQITSNQIKADISCQKNELNLILIWKKNCNKMLKGHSCFDLIFLTFAVLDWFSILFLSHLISLFAWLRYYTHAFMSRYINVWRMYQLSLRALFTFFLPVQGRRKVWKYRWAINNMVGIIYWSWLEEW